MVNFGITDFSAQVSCQQEYGYGKSSFRCKWHASQELKWVAMPSFRELPDPGIELRWPSLQDSLPTEPPGEPISTHQKNIILMNTCSTTNWPAKNRFSCTYCLFMHLWRDVYSKPFVCYWIELLFLSFSSLHIPNVSPLSGVWFVSILSHSWVNLYSVASVFWGGTCFNFCGNQNIKATGYNQSNFRRKFNL